MDLTVAPAREEFRAEVRDWLAANVRYAGTDETILPSYAVTTL